MGFKLSLYLGFVDCVFILCCWLSGYGGGFFWDCDLVVWFRFWF